MTVALHPLMAGVEHVMLQDVNSVEVRACRLACLMNDIPHSNASLEKIAGGAHALGPNTLLVGSVEFVQAGLTLLGCSPAPMSYPRQVKRFLRRSVQMTTIDELMASNHARIFVKPVAVKLFTGFVFVRGRSFADYSESDQQSYHEMRALAGSTPVWISEEVRFLSEWRYYVQNGQVLGCARYDDGPDQSLEPSVDEVMGCVKALGRAAPYCLDFGVDASGQTLLVEANDAWAIGLYGKALEPVVYLRFLAQRWASFFHSNPGKEESP